MSSSLDRQNFMLEKVLEICHKEFSFDSFEEVAPFFKKVINQLKQMNYATFESEDFGKNTKKLKSILQEREVQVEV
jgi:V/A-type H+/Na+-transporting ATPase subunit A